MHPFDEIENRIANLHKNVSCMSHKMENSFDTFFIKTMLIKKEEEIMLIEILIGIV